MRLWATDFALPCNPISLAILWGQSQISNLVCLLLRHTFDAARQRWFDIVLAGFAHREMLEGALLIVTIVAFSPASAVDAVLNQQRHVRVGLRLGLPSVQATVHFKPPLAPRCTGMGEIKTVQDCSVHM